GAANQLVRARAAYAGARLCHLAAGHGPRPQGGRGARARYPWSTADARDIGAYVAYMRAIAGGRPDRHQPGAALRDRAAVPAGHRARAPRAKAPFGGAATVAIIMVEGWPARDRRCLRAARAARGGCASANARGRPARSEDNGRWRWRAPRRLPGRRRLLFCRGPGAVAQSGVEFVDQIG